MSYSLLIHFQMSILVDTKFLIDSRYLKSNLKSIWIIPYLLAYMFSGEKLTVNLTEDSLLAYVCLSSLFLKIFAPQTP